MVRTPGPLPALPLPLPLLPLLLLITAGFIYSTNAVQVHETQLATIYDKLLTGNQLVRPVWTGKTPVIVYVQFYLFQIKELNSVDQTLSVCGFFHLSWFDGFMTWNSTETGVDRIQVPSKKIWLPEFAIYNSADGTFRDPIWMESDPILSSNGLVGWSPQGLFTTSCSINILYFPFDKQQCQIILSNWMQFSSEIYFVNSTSKPETTYYMANSEWILKDTSIQSRSLPSTPGYPPPRNIAVTLYLDRRYESYVSNILLPLGFLSIMGMLVFPLSVESGEKISLGVTMLLAFSVFQLLISENLPKSSENIPYIMLYVVALMAMNATSIAMTILVLHFHHKDPAPRLPRWARKFLFDFLGKITCYGASTNEISPEKDPKMEEMKIEEVKEFEMKKSFNGHDLGYLMSDTLKEVQKITRKMEENEAEEAIKGEWKRAATILDRFFFIVSFTAWLIATIVVMSLLTSG